MKKLSYLFLALGFFTFITSCDDDPKGSDGGGEKLTGDLIINTNPITADDHKANVENTAVALVSDIGGMKDEEAVDIMFEFTKLAENTSALKKSGTSNFVNHRIGFLTEESPITGFLQFKSQLADFPADWTDLWDSITGVWEYDFQIKDFVNTSTDGNELLIKFPSTETGTTNDAQIRAFGFTFYDGVLPEAIDSLDMPLEGIPSGLKIELSQGSTVYMSMNFSATFDAQGYPDVVQASYAMGGYELSVAFDNNQTSKVSGTYSIKKDDKILMEITAGLNGDWSDTNVENNRETVSEEYTYWDYVWNDTTQQYDQIEYTYTDTWEEFHGQNVFKMVNASLQLLNIKFEGSLNIEAMVNEQEDLPDTEEWTPEWDSTNTYAETAIANKYLIMKCLYADNSRLIADLNLKVIRHSEDYTYYDYVWNETTQQYDEVPYTYEDVWFESYPFMVFKDGSVVDPAFYFSENFDELWTQINSLMNDIEQQFNTDPIDDINPDGWEIQTPGK